MKTVINKMVLLTLSFWASMGFAQQIPFSQLTEKQALAVDTAITKEMEKQQVIGLTLGIIQKGQVVYLQGYGYEDREENIPMTSKSMFRWASISKTLTAVSAMQLVEKGLLDLTADIRGYVPEFPDHQVRITSQQLLCHQGGIVHYTNGKVIPTIREYDMPHPYENVVLALDTFRASPLIACPGEKYSYTTRGFILLSAIVERAGGEKFAEQVRKRISIPLQLKTLQPDYQWETIPHRVIGYQLKKGKVIRSTDTDVSWKLGGGGFISNINDLANYAAGLINRNLLSKQSEQLMWTKQKTNDGKLTPVGLGFFVDSQNDTLEISHNGGQEKTRTRLVIYPRQGYGIVVMSNCEYAIPSRFTTVAYAALEDSKTDSTK